MVVVRGRRWDGVGRLYIWYGVGGLGRRPEEPLMIKWSGGTEEA